MKYTAEELIEAFGNIQLNDLPAITKELRKLLDEEPGPPAGAGVLRKPITPTLGGAAIKVAGEE